MPNPIIQVTAPSRLHFGLLAIGEGSERRFGGLGAMIQSPGLRLTVRRAAQLEVRGPLAARAEQFARRIASSVGIESELACRIEIEHAPPEHVGLGTGTQLGLAVGAALNAFVGHALRPASELAGLMGRGVRSAIGIHGFDLGGLILERGKLADEPVSPLAARVSLPPAWRFVLLRPCVDEGLSGDSELEAFRTLHSIADSTTERLARLAEGVLLPAAAAGDFAAFSHALYEYGHAAGMCFAAIQGGPFASPVLADIVQRLRDIGIEGVGQSSWGPTIFALAENQFAGERIAAQMSAIHGRGVGITISPPANEGAQIRTLTV
ncbi:MAG: beta-RFAP synthase [Planctomycetia bacterium]|nr:beta-RFAP synthase [Planctomycetia bacterium]